MCVYTRYTLCWSHRGFFPLVSANAHVILGERAVLSAMPGRLYVEENVTLLTNYSRICWFFHGEFVQWGLNFCAIYDEILKDYSDFQLTVLDVFVFASYKNPVI